MQINKRKLFPLTIVLLLAVGLSACAGGGAMPDRSWPESLVDGDTIYMVNHSYIYAVDASHLVNNDKAKELTGFGDPDKLRYPKDAEGSTSFGSAPVKLGDRLLLTDYTGHIRTIGTGSDISAKIASEVAAGRFFASATVTDNLILAANADHVLYAYDKDLNAKWTYKEAKDALWAKPVVSGDLIIVASIDHNVYALKEAADGKGAEKVWSYDAGGPVFFSLTADEDGNLYVGTMNNELHCLDVKTGSLKWKVSTAGTVWSPVVTKGDRIYGGDQSGKLFSLNKSDGRTVWDYDTHSPVIGSVVLNGTDLYAGTFDGRAVGLSNTDGNAVTVKCDIKVGGKLLSTPVIAGEYVVFGVVDGDKLLAGYSTSNITIQTEKPDWTFTPSK
jgi:outer membrane protein assembly factor BamB